MTISLIVAMDKNRLIGHDNSLPWMLPSDLAYFKNLTLNHTIIMGRLTYESIGKPLPNRTNIILTKDASFQVDNCYTYNSIEDILNEYNNYASPDEEVFVIGGSNIFSQFLPYAAKLYITEIDHEFEGNINFPKYDKSEWTLISSQKGIKNDLNPYDYYFNQYIREGECKMTIQNGVYETTKLIAEYKESKNKK